MARTLLGVGVAVWLTACGARDVPEPYVPSVPGANGDPLCSGTRWYPDVDGDGFGDTSREESGCQPPAPDWIRDGTDCDDTVGAVHPGVPEVEDGVDQDCNGDVDDGTPAFDNDGDGYCARTDACASPDHAPGDCDDTQAHTYPGAEERCDLVDNDCDGLLPPLERDGDGDGFAACNECDDAEPRDFPGAVERCDRVDNDCNGIADDLDADGDGWIGCGLSSGRIDVVVVVDDSAGMADEQATFAAMLDAIVAQMDRERFDYRIMVITTSSDQVVGAIIAPDVTDPLAFLASALDVGTAGNPVEAPLGMVASFLRGSVGRSLRRPGAALAVWILTNEDDQSDENPLALLDELRGDLPEGLVAVSAVSAGWAACSGAGGVAAPSPRLMAAVEASGGGWASICGGSWSNYWGRAWMPLRALDCDDGEALAFPGAADVCDGIDNDCDGDIDNDGDGDGLSACDGDCDPRRADAHPDAVELCNGLDDDCDGVVGAEEADVDRDGFRVCDGDCNDRRFGEHPGVVETCGDGIDQDCSGDDGGPTDRADADGDGYDACSGDCDDADATTFPYAPEHAFDGVDNDCDGLTDGRDHDQLTVFADPSDSWLGTLSASTPLMTLCGETFTGARLSSDGFILAGSGGPLFDDSPNRFELMNRSPMVSAGWAPLNPAAWEGGRFLQGYGRRGPIFTVRRGASLTVVYDAVPYANDLGGTLSAVTTMGPNVLDIVVTEANPVETMVGYACAHDGWELLTLAPVTCIDPVHVLGASAFLDRAASLPVRLTTDCVP